MYDMTIQLRSDCGKCLYEQIYEHIRQEIREGRLLAGERLPSTRFLAEYLQVARSTVDFAYGQLQSEGYIEARPQRGYFVCRLEELFQMEDSRASHTAQVTEGAAQTGAGRTGMAADRAVHVAEAEAGEDASAAADVPVRYDFSPNDIDMEGFPFSVWSRITKNILQVRNSELFSLGEPQGDPELRETISRYLHASRGVNCSPEQIIVGAGNDYLLLLLEKLLGRHVKIAMENPTYKRAYQIFQSCAYRIETVDVDENGMIVAQLKDRDVTCVYVMPSHQFPTGAVMPIGRRTELLRWADEGEERYLIEDDYDSEFRYHGKPIPSLQASDKHGRVIYIGTFSKAIAPAIRVSYMVLPQTLLERYRKECYFYSSTVSRIDQRVLNEFIRDGYFERHLNKMRKCYRTRHDLLLELLKPFEEKFALFGENAGLHVLLAEKGERKEEELIRRAAAVGVKVYGLSDSYITSPSACRAEGCAPWRNPERATILLGYGNLKEDQLRCGAELLKDAWL